MRVISAAHGCPNKARVTLLPLLCSRLHGGDYTPTLSTVLSAMLNVVQDTLNDDRYAHMTLTWRDLGVRVPKKCDLAPSTLMSLFKRSNANLVSILDQVNGRAESGHLVAVMGSSGCGKTTLLAALGQRIKGNVSGQILVNGIPAPTDSIAKISGFVPQHDVAVETLTTIEHLSFMACMKLDRRLDRVTRQKWIVSILHELNLAGSEDTRLSALSGGERRRLSLAVELLTDPAILFCDEPTTGLDSFSALTVVEKLKHLSNRGKLVICSIHQPASEIFSCFSHIMLLSGGRLAYQGTIPDAYSFFSSLGLVCPESYNPAEFYVQQLSLSPDTERESLEKIRHICDAFEHSEQFERLNTTNNNLGSSGSPAFNQESSTYPSLPDVSEKSHSPSSEAHTRRLVSSSVSRSVSRETELETRRRVWASEDGECDFSETSGREGYRPQWFVQMYWLIWRSTLDTGRNLRSHCIQLAVFLVTAVILTAFYWNVQTNSQAGIQDCRGLLYLICAEVIYTSAYTVFNTFPNEIHLFLREKGMYSSTVYYISKIMCLVPRATLEPLAYLAIIYTIRDLNDYFKMALPLVLVSHAATAYGCMLSSAFNSPDMAATMSQPLDTLFFLMGGLYFNINTFPAWITWLKYLSMFYYSNELISVIHWSRVDKIACPVNPSLPCLENGAEVLSQYGFKADNMTVDVLGLAVLYISLHLIGFLGIWRRSREQAVY